MGMEYRHFYLAKELIRMGHAVTIVAASYSHLRGQNPLPEHTMQETIEAHVPFVWIKTPPYYRNNAFRMRNIAAFLSAVWLRAKELAVHFSPDVVVASSTYLLDLYPAARIARYAGAKLVFELHDVWPLSLMELHGFSERHPFMRLLAKAERASYQMADTVIGLLPKTALRAQELGITDKKITYVPNGIEDKTPKPDTVSRAQHRIQALHAQNIFTVVYVGGFAQANALQTLVQACSYLPAGIAVVLVGKGECKDELAAYAAHNNLRNLYFEEYVPKGQVLGVLEHADCLYIGAKASGLYRYGIGMNKLYDYMLAARPILFAIDAPDNEVTQSGCGICIEPQNAGALAGGIVRLRGMTAAERDSMGQRGREFVLAHRNYRHLAQRFLEAIQ